MRKHLNYLRFQYHRAWLFIVNDPLLCHLLN